MARPVAEQPTELELQFLKILWEKSPQPVREIRDALAEVGPRHRSHVGHHDVEHDGEEANLDT